MGGVGWGVVRSGWGWVEDGLGRVDFWGGVGVHPVHLAHNGLNSQRCYWQREMTMKSTIYHVTRRRVHVT